MVSLMTGDVMLATDYADYERTPCSVREKWRRLTTLKSSMEKVQTSIPPTPSLLLGCTMDVRLDEKIKIIITILLI